MNKHLFLAAVLAGVLSLSALAAAQSQLDIALEGPWILYQDLHFSGKNNKQIPVLVAIAPLSATMNSAALDIQHHHVPQISTGEGYYVGDKGIYCLDFDGQCAPKGASSLSDGHGYPPGHLLQVPSGSTPWLWPQKSSGNVAIVLPMPNFYSNDGLWQVRFRKTYDIKASDVTYSDATTSIGIVLHYTKGPAVLRLFSCDAATPAAKNCTMQVKDKDGNDVMARNTGMLRLQMRAPDTDSVCDHHVRFAYHQMFTLFGNPSSNQDYAYIEPANGIKIASDGTSSGQYEDEGTGHHDCFDSDQNAQDQGTLMRPPFDQASPTGDLNGQGKPAGQEETTFDGALQDLRNLSKHDSESHSLQRAVDNVQEASEERDKLSGIRKISLDRNFEAHLSDAIALIDAFKNEKHLTPDDLTTLLKVETFLRILADGTKNGADCRAPLVLVQ